MSRASRTVYYGGKRQALPDGPHARAVIFRDALVKGCFGPDRVDPDLYSVMRAMRLEDEAMLDLWPEYIGEIRDAAEFWEFIQLKSSWPYGRKGFVHDSFRPLLKRLKYDEEKESIARLRAESSRPTAAVSFQWTGRRTLKQQRVVVLALVPKALQALEVLMREQELRHHNGPPGAVETDSLSSLRELHAALSELLALADGGHALAKAMTKVGRLVSRTFAFVKETSELYVGGLPTIATSTVSAWGTFAICRCVVGLDGAPSATMSGAAVAATIVGVTTRKSKPKANQSKRRPRRGRGKGSPPPNEIV